MVYPDKIRIKVFAINHKYIIFICLVLTSCSNDLEEVKKVAKKVEANTEWGVDVEMNYSEYGKPRARLSAPELQRITISNIPKTEFPKGFQLVIFNEFGQIENTLTANYGLSDDINKNMVAQNNVTVVNIKGDRLNTEELIWNQTNKQIYSHKFVKITTKKEIIMGDSLIADEKFTDYTIKKVTGTVTVDQK